MRRPLPRPLALPRPLPRPFLRFLGAVASMTFLKSRSACIVSKRVASRCRISSTSRYQRSSTLKDHTWSDTVLKQYTCQGLEEWMTRSSKNFVSDMITGHPHSTCSSSRCFRTATSNKPDPAGSLSHAMISQPILRLSAQREEWGWWGVGGVGLGVGVVGRVGPIGPCGPIGPTYLQSIQSRQINPIKSIHIQDP